jgi:outer membrane protein assembly factor BamB
MLNSRTLILTALATAAAGFFLIPRYGVRAGADAASPNKMMAMFACNPARNMVNLVEKNLPTEWQVPKTAADKGTNIKWIAKLGSVAYGLTVAGDKAFVGTNNHSPRNKRDTRKRRDGRDEPVDKGILMCFNTANGEFLWQHVNDKLESGIVNDWTNEGVCSTPTVEGNRVYYVSNRCEVVCLDANGLADGNQGVQDEKYKDKTDADVIWRLDMIHAFNVFPHNMAACSPLVTGDTVYVVTANGVDEGHINIPAPDAPSFIAVDKATGKEKWKSNLPGRNIMHGQWSNPTLAVIGGKEQVIFPGGDGWLYGLEPATGKEIWKFDANPKDSKYELGGRGTRSDFIGTPTFYEGRIYIGTGQDPEHFDGVGHLWCIDPAGKTGDISPEVVTDASSTPPKTKRNPNTGAVWHFGGAEKDPLAAGRDYVFGRTMSTCAIHEGLCYACDLAGFLHCLDAKTGQLYWKYDTKSAVWGSPYWVDGKVYLGVEDGDIVIFEHGMDKYVKGPDGQPKVEPKKVEMGAGQVIRSTPVASGGVLYVMSESHLFAIQKK